MSELDRDDLQEVMLDQNLDKNDKNVDLDKDKGGYDEE